MKVAIIGTVGVPANYGGFETLVENLLSYKSNDQIQYTVYCSSKRYKKKLNTYKGAKLEYISFDANGKQAFIYDSISLLKAIRKHDVILSLGAACAPVLPIVKRLTKKKIIINLDGIDTKRAKFTPLIRKILNTVRQIAAKYATVCVSDNEGIRKYVMETYRRESELIEYGGDNAEIINNKNHALENLYGLEPLDYSFKVARIEAENNIEMILKAFSETPDEKLVIVGNWNKSEFGIKMKQLYTNYSNILLLDPIYDGQQLNLLRSNCKYYIHGHSVGGTNPSLVEAMNLGLAIIAFDCIFNRETTENKALYFSDSQSLKKNISKLNNDKDCLANIKRDMYEIAKRRYTWNIITRKYENLYTNERTES